MKHILYCKTCSKYTMKEKCTCGNKAESTKPAKYSPEDKYGSYRRKARAEVLHARGLL